MLLSTPVTAPRPRLPNGAALELGRLPASTPPPQTGSVIRVTRVLRHLLSQSQRLHPVWDSTVSPCLSPCCGLAASPLCSGSRWERDLAETYQTHVTCGSWPLCRPLGGRGQAGVTLKPCGFPPTPHRCRRPTGSPRGQRRVRALRGVNPSPPPPRTPIAGGRLPASLSQQRKTSLDGNCRRVVTATLLQDFTRNPAFRAQKDTRVPARPGRCQCKTHRGRERVSGTEGWSDPNHRCPQDHPACHRWGWGHGERWGPGDTGAASWEQLGAEPSVLPGRCRKDGLDVGLGAWKEP